MVLKKWLSEKRMLKAEEYKAYKQERENIAFKKEETKAMKQRMKIQKARAKGKEKAYTPLGTGIKTPKIKPTYSTVQKVGRGIRKYSEERRDIFGTAKKPNIVFKK